jgi:hypothetical protein
MHGMYSYWQAQNITLSRSIRRTYNKQPIKLESIVLPVAIHCQLNKYDVGLPIANSARISFNHYLRHPVQLP